jgi:hypothetical protein
MKPENIGRALGIGLRVAGRMAGQRLIGVAQAAGTGQIEHNTQAKQAVVSAAARGEAAGRTAKGVARGVGGFLRPFRRVGGILWLEVTGAFFFLFVLAAALPLWRNRPSHLYGPYDKNFLAAAGIMVVFFYLGASSFWRARKR